MQHVLVQEAVGNQVRAAPGDRFEQLFEARVDALVAAGESDRLAIDSAEARLSFAELDGRANRLARWLKAQGIGSGDRLALLFDKSIYSYIATLAVLKLQAAYVPLDQSFPADRIGFIAEDAAVRAILSISRYATDLAPSGVQVLLLDQAEAAIAVLPAERLTAEEKGPPVEDLAYVIYTSGSTGKPKGVVIDHIQIVNFVRVAAEVYGIRPDDRMYQGLTIAFDFAVEEIWVPLVVGATLVPGPLGVRLVGEDLARFLEEQKITALCCVPTLLATLEAELPLLRYIMVSGEACPQDLVARWEKPGRVFLNAYGPTEATVTATFNRLVAGKPVTIGKPLPTYSIVILDPNGPTVLPFGEAGEIGIGGIGVARGYLNRDELTAKVFIPDFVGLPENTSGRIYRTGDLARINADGDIEYMGRIDTQVKIRGYRIELTEIESVLMQHPDIAQAVVSKHEATPGAVELAAYYTLKPGIADLDLGALVETLRAALPAYMVPAFYERLEVMPLLPSHKADRKKLPPPSGPRFASRRGELVTAEGAIEEAMAAALGTVLGVDTVSVEDHFFDDMGANSLLMAQFCTKLRESGVVADVSMRDTYQHPTIRALAAHLGSAPAAALPEAEAIAPHVAPRWAYIATGVAQALTWFAYLSLTSFVFVAAVDTILDGRDVLDHYLRSALATLGVLAFLVVMPVALKWLVIGRWKPERFPVWGLKYFRFWLIRQLLALNPMVLFAGTPLYNVYLRALGARVGRHAAILSGALPVATDLVSIGEEAMLSKTASLSGYRVRGGWVETGPITIGNRAFVGEASVIGIGTAIGDDAQLGNSSSLHPGQSIPAGKSWHGSPALETSVNYDRVPRLPVGSWRRASYTIVQIVWVYLLLVPVPVALILGAFPDLATLGDTHLSGTDVFDLHWLELIGGALLWSLIAYAAGIVLSLATIWAVPRIASLFLKPDTAYPLYGLRYFLLRAIGGFSNSRSMNNLFGDSSWITSYLSFVGWNLGTVKQTGSNFGSLQAQDVPFLVTVGTGTMVSDGLTMTNAETSATAFMISETRIGADNYLGNAISFPAGARTGDNVLLASKVLVPIEGPIVENAGLLGSPPFVIPRTVKRDTQFDHLRSGPEFERRLRMKNAANLRAMGLYLLSRWLFGFIGFFFFALAIAEQPLIGPWGLALAAMATVVVGMVYFTLVERLTLGFGRLQPRYVSIYDPYYWYHERHWKVADASGLLTFFNGTPFKGFVWRLLGVRVGRQLFDDGAMFSERTLVTLGDHVTLGNRVTLQGHTLEDATFKSGAIVLGDGASIGSNCYVNYEVSVGAGASLELDSFLMKGEQVPPGTVWGGNPARQMSRSRT